MLGVGIGWVVGEMRVGGWVGGWEGFLTSLSRVKQWSEFSISWWMERVAL